MNISICFKWGRSGWNLFVALGGGHGSGFSAIMVKIKLQKDNYSYFLSVILKSFVSSPPKT